MDSDCNNEKGRRKRNLNCRPSTEKEHSTNSAPPNMSLWQNNNNVNNNNKMQLLFYDNNNNNEEEDIRKKKWKLLLSGFCFQEQNKMALVNWETQGELSLPGIYVS